MVYRRNSTPKSSPHSTHYPRCRVNDTTRYCSLDLYRTFPVILCPDLGCARPGSDRIRRRGWPCWIRKLQPPNIIMIFRGRYSHRGIYILFRFVNLFLFESCGLHYFPNKVTLKCVITQNCSFSDIKRLPSLDWCPETLINFVALLPRNQLLWWIFIISLLFCGA